MTTKRESIRFYSRRARKAVSPLIAAVLLIAVTVAIAIALTAWVASFTKGKEEQVAQSEKQLQCTYQRIDADQTLVNYDPDTHIMKAYVTNTGTDPIEVRSIRAWKRNSPTAEVPVPLKTNANNTLEVNQGRLFYLNLAQFGEPERVRFETGCPAVYSSLFRPNIGWSKFTYAGQPLNLE